MQARWTLTIGTTLALIGALLVWLYREEPVTAAAPPAATAEVTTETRAPAAAATVEQAQAPSRALPETATPASNEAVGTVRSSIHFERAAKGANAAAKIDVNARYAVGIWQPAQHRLRILLLESSPGAAEAASMISTLPSVNAASPPTKPAAVIDLYFIPTAQAFDRSEVEIATLTAVSAHGENSAADVLNSLDWQGSLPSPQAGGASATTSLRMSSSGNGESADRDSWHQTWKFDVEVPVSLVE